MTNVSAVSGNVYPTDLTRQQNGAQAPAQASSQAVANDQDHDGDHDQPGKVDVKG